MSDVQGTSVSNGSVRTSNGVDTQKNKKKKKPKDGFRYGNYNQYYGKRLNAKFQRDPRLSLFQDRWFRGKKVLDVGCNVGIITILIAKEMEPRRILGIDIDSTLVGIARKNIRHYCDEGVKIPGKIPVFSASNSDTPKFPDNVWFNQSNYVLETDELLEMIVPEYNVILALSITKWIHLNWGDAGLRRFFKRAYLQLQPNGRLILETQSFDSYAKRAKVNEEMKRHLKEIKLMPDQFNEYLLNTVGFREAVELGTPEGSSEGFSRPLVMYIK